MAVKNPRRMTRRSPAHRALRFVKSLQTYPWRRRPAVPIAVASVAIIGILAFASTVSAPSADRAATEPQRQARTSAPARVTAPPVDRNVTDVALEPAEIVGPQPEIVTLTGCLERSDDEFRLSKTSGTNAPKARSWKSGFLTRRPASVTVMPVSKQMDLSRHVGQRVTVTGPLVDREMRVRTLRRIAPCGDGSRV
jgi:hypothetical protein